MNYEEKELKQARRHVRRLRHFYSHLITYGVVITFLHIINLLTAAPYWAFWPALGWGMAIALHAINALHFTKLFGSEWVEREVQKILEKQNAKSDAYKNET